MALLRIHNILLSQVSCCCSLITSFHCSAVAYTHVHIVALLRLPRYTAVVSYRLVTLQCCCRCLLRMSVYWARWYSNTGRCSSATVAPQIGEKAAAHELCVGTAWVLMAVWAVWALHGCSWLCWHCCAMLCGLYHAVWTLHGLCYAVLYGITLLLLR